MYDNDRLKHSISSKNNTNWIKEEINKSVHISKTSTVLQTLSSFDFSKIGHQCSFAYQDHTRYQTIQYVAAQQMEFQPLPFSWFVGCTVSVAPSHVMECTRQRAGYWCRDWSGARTSDPPADARPGRRLGMWGGCEVVSPCSLWPSLYLFTRLYVLGLTV